MKTLTVMLLVVFFSSLLAGCPQSPAALEPSGNAAPRVTLDIVVTDKAGNAVTGLQQKDFTVLVDKHPQTILSFRASDESNKESNVPQIILLIDTINSTTGTASSTRQQLKKFLRQGSGTLPVPMSLVLFNDKSTQMQGAPTRDGNALANFLDSADAGMRDFDRGRGFYLDVERIQRSLRTLEKLAAYEAKQPGRKLLIWLSPGWPMMFSPNTQLARKDEETIFHTVVTLSTQLREARITVYSIDTLGIDDAGGFQTFYYQNYLKGVASASKVESGDVALQVIAVQTGGQVFNRDNDVAKLVATCLTDAKAYYTLSFPSATAGHPDEYHDIGVDIGKSGLPARTRTGYYAQPLDVAK